MVVVLLLQDHLELNLDLKLNLNLNLKLNLNLNLKLNLNLISFASQMQETRLRRCLALMKLQFPPTRRRSETNHHLPPEM